MFIVPIGRKSYFIVAAIFSLMLASSEASAATILITHIYEPGVACRSSPVSSVGAGWAALGNWSGSQQTFWCPIWSTASDSSLLDGEGGPWDTLFVDVSANGGHWATLSSCVLAELQTPTLGFWIHPNRIDQQSGYDTIELPRTVVGTNFAAEVECYMPNNQVLMDINYDDEFYFH